MPLARRLTIENDARERNQAYEKRVVPRRIWNNLKCNSARDTIIILSLHQVGAEQVATKNIDLFDRSQESPSRTQVRQNIHKDGVIGRSRESHPDPEIEHRPQQ